MLASFGFSPCKSFSFNSALATYQFIGFPPQVDMLAYDWTEYPRGHTRWNFFFLKKKHIRLFCDTSHYKFVLIKKSEFKKKKKTINKFK
jgi:hypothetical protein